MSLTAVAADPQIASTTSTGPDDSGAGDAGADGEGGDSQSNPAAPNPSAVSSSSPLDSSNQDPMAVPATPSTPTTLTGSTTSSPISAAVVHNRPPTIALAIPLSIVGTILLATLVLACHHQRKLAADRETEAILLRDAERSVSVQGFGGFHGSAALDELSRRSSLLSNGSDVKSEKAMLPKLDVDVEKALIIGALLTK